MHRCSIVNKLTRVQVKICSFGFLWSSIFKMLVQGKKLGPCVHKPYAWSRRCCGHYIGSPKVVVYIINPRGRFVPSRGLIHDIYVHIWISNKSIETVGLCYSPVSLLLSCLKFFCAFSNETSIFQLIKTWLQIIAFRKSFVLFCGTYKE